MYRSVSHKKLRDICELAIKPRLSSEHNPYFPQHVFGTAITNFAKAVLELKEKRESADYDPLFQPSRAEAIAAVAMAHEALEGFRKASREQRKVFLALLLFEVRN